MKRYLFIILAVAFSLLGVFGLAQVIGIPLLADPSPWLEPGNPLTALVTTGLLAIDVLLPIPSSLIMSANGAMFGFTAGSILSIAGSMVAAMLGYRLGASGSRLINRFIPAEQQEQGRRFFRRWGMLAVIITRPVPILAETVAIVAGVSRMNLRQFLLASLAGIIPAVVLYAYAGTTASGAVSKLLLFVVILAIAGLFWLIGMVAKRRLSAKS